jgi:hypothetical protein
MVISVIQEGKGVLHFSGELDPYNIQLVSHHAANLTASPEQMEIRIALDPRERAALTPENERLLNRLATAGFSVSARSRRKEGRV